MNRTASRIGSAVFFADPDGLKLELVWYPWGYWRKVMTEGRDERPRLAPK